MRFLLLLVCIHLVTQLAISAGESFRLLHPRLLIIAGCSPRSEAKENVVCALHRKVSLGFWLTKVYFIFTTTFSLWTESVAIALVVFVGRGALCPHPVERKNIRGFCTSLSCFAVETFSSQTIICVYQSQVQRTVSLIHFPVYYHLSRLASLLLVKKTKKEATNTAWLCQDSFRFVSRQLLASTNMLLTSRRIQCSSVAG